MIIRTHAYARAGLMGNPSDGYYGKTIAFAIKNFKATVTLWESPYLQIIPHPMHDPMEFGSLSALEEVAARDGYYGGMRLVLATCKKFKEYCDERGIRLAPRNFTLRYDTDIPRQVGLGGSSAIITAAFRALMRFYGLSEAHIPLPLQPNIILSVEEDELDIRAGLQDRVVQVYGGMVFMDFARKLLEQRGYGEYQRMDIRLLPPLFLAYIKEPSESGKIHSDVRYRFQQGNADVVQAMKTFASYAVKAKQALEQQDHRTLASLMNQNFDLRRRIFGDKVIGARNLAMIELARSLGLPSKFPGSSGAVLGMYETKSQLADLSRLYQAHGFEFVRLRVR